MYPVEDPQALRNPRRDTTYTSSGTLTNGSTGEGSRVFQWGWNPVGGARSIDSTMTENSLVLTVSIGSVTVTTT